MFCTLTWRVDQTKSFTRWLQRDRRTNEDRLVHLSFMNAEVDRRHSRRALSSEEFSLLIEAARNGQVVESISGPDRAMMYVLATWTGFRKGEIGSLTLRSLRLNDDPPIVSVAAGYSKRRREDRQVLHPELVKQLRSGLPPNRIMVLRTYCSRFAGVCLAGPNARRTR
jgi:integrase